MTCRILDVYEHNKNCTDCRELVVLLMWRDTEIEELKKKIAELKRQAADNADALLAAYQQGRADGKGDNTR